MGQPNLELIPNNLLISLLSIYLYLVVLGCTYLRLVLSLSIGRWLCRNTYYLGSTPPRYLLLSLLSKVSKPRKVLGLKESPPNFFVLYSPLLPSFSIQFQLSFSSSSSFPCFRQVPLLHKYSVGDGDRWMILRYPLSCRVLHIEPLRHDRN